MQSVGFEIQTDKGSYYYQEKWLRGDKASEKPIETTAKSSFMSFLASGASGASFLGYEAAKQWQIRNRSCAIKKSDEGLFW